VHAVLSMLRCPCCDVNAVLCCPCCAPCCAVPAVLCLLCCAGTASWLTGWSRPRRPSRPRTASAPHMTWCAAARPAQLQSVLLLHFFLAIWHPCRVQQHVYAPCLVTHPSWLLYSFLVGLLLHFLPVPHTASRVCMVSIHAHFSTMPPNPSRSCGLSSCLHRHSPGLADV
jgi:hypothetical protein